MKKFKLWDKCFVLALDKRKEHWQNLIEEGKSVGVEIHPFVCGDGSDKELVYDQIDDTNVDLSGWGYGVREHLIHHWNALKAHKAIIQKAKDENLDSVLLLEDDARFLFSRFEYIVSRIEDNEEWVRFCNKFHLFYLSWWKGSETDQENLAIEENWKTHKAISLIPIQPGENVGGLHAVVIRKEVYDFILSCPMNNPLDSQFCQNRQNIDSLLLYPKIIHTKDMYSNTEGCFLTRLQIE